MRDEVAQHTITPPAVLRRWRLRC